MIYYSAEARGYGLMMALVLLSTLAVLLAIDSGRRRWWVAYALLTCAAVYTHYTALFVLAVQFLWILWAHPELRRTAIVASVAAAIGFAPWLPGLRADLDSPTTQILASLSPFNFDTIEQSLQHWSIGFPYSQFSELTDVPGTFALVLLGLAVVAGIVGVAFNRAEVGQRLAAADRRIVLIVALALGHAGGGGRSEPDRVRRLRHQEPRCLMALSRPGFRGAADRRQAAAADRRGDACHRRVRDRHGAHLVRGLRPPELRAGRRLHRAAAGRRRHRRGGADARSARQLGRLVRFRRGGAARRHS